MRHCYVTRLSCHRVTCHFLSPRSVPFPPAGQESHGRRKAAADAGAANCGEEGCNAAGTVEEGCEEVGETREANHLMQRPREHFSSSPSAQHVCSCVQSCTYTIRTLKKALDKGKQKPLLILFIDSYN